MYIHGIFYEILWEFWWLLFRSFHFSFLVIGHSRWLSYENMKTLPNLCLHFARQDGRDGKKIMQLKWPKYQKPKDKNMEEQNINFVMCQIEGKYFINT